VVEEMEEMEVTAPSADVVRHTDARPGGCSGIRNAAAVSIPCC